METQSTTEIHVFLMAMEKTFSPFVARKYFYYSRVVFHAEEAAHIQLSLKPSITMA